MARTLTALVAFVGVVMLGGCEILFWLTLDPAGLPCKTNLEPGESACLAGYTCVEGRCQYADSQPEGEPCTIDAECEPGLVCRDQYENVAGECKRNQYDRVCDTGDSSIQANSGGKLCRQECSPNADWADTCQDGFHCFPDAVGAVSGYCQPGNCQNDTECGNDGLCFLKDYNKDTAGNLGSGLCFETCSPLNCNPVGGCVGCPTDDDVDGDENPDVMNCAPLESIERLVCVVAGTGQRLDNCVDQEDCAPGLACIGTQCLAWCTLTPGDPDCNVGEICNPVPNSPVNDLGYCL